jgi:hypothetical protein
MMSLQAKRFYEFGAFHVDVANRLLLREGEVVPPAPRAIDVFLLSGEGQPRSAFRLYLSYARSATGFPHQVESL